MPRVTPGAVPLSATCSTGEDLSATPVDETPVGTFIHSTSQMEFPESIGEFRRVEVTRYDSDGADVSVGYNATSPPLAATVYVFPAEGDLQHEFERARAEVEGVHTGYTILSDNEATAVSNPRDRNGLKALFRYSQAFGGQATGVQSELYVFLLGDNTVEYRFTYPDGSDQSARIRRFMESLPWPEA